MLDGLFAERGDDYNGTAAASAAATAAMPSDDSSTDMTVAVNSVTFAVTMGAGRSAGVDTRRRPKMRPRGVTSEERDALAKLYVATGGETWTKSGRWLNKDPTTWFGTVWEEIEGKTRLVKLLLSSNNLQNELPEVFGAFTHLRVLNLDNNQMTGALPACR